MPVPTLIRLAISSVTSPEQTGTIKLSMLVRGWEETEPNNASDILITKAGYIVPVGNNLLELRVNGIANSVADLRDLHFETIKLNDTGKGYPSDPNPPNIFTWTCIETG